MQVWNHSFFFFFFLSKANLRFMFDLFLSSLGSDDVRFSNSDSAQKESFQETSVADHHTPSEPDLSCKSEPLRAWQIAKLSGFVCVCVLSFYKATDERKENREHFGSVLGREETEKKTPVFCLERQARTEKQETRRNRAICSHGKD
jgi:hypothetical protein